MTPHEGLLGTLYHPGHGGTCEGEGEGEMQRARDVGRASEHGKW